MMAWVRNGWVGGFLVGAMLNAALVMLSSGSSFPGSVGEQLMTKHDTSTRILTDLEEENEEEVGVRFSILHLCGNVPAVLVLLRQGNFPLTSCFAASI
jgi:hypothetical protein